LAKFKRVDEREEARIGFLSLLAAGIGFAGGVIACVLYHLIGLLTNIAYYGRVSVSFVSPAGTAFFPYAIAIPAIGGLIAGLLIRYGSPKIEGHGIPEAMESVLLNRSRIEPKVGVLKAVSAAVTIGTGQPFGAEGPIIQTGGAFGSFVGQRIRVTGSERRILLASGAAAGMAATFGTPIAAIVLVIELLLFEFRVKSLIPVAIASAIGAWLHIYLISAQPLFQTQSIAFGGLVTLPFYVGLGLLCGVLGTLLSRGLYKSEDAFEKIGLGQPWLPTIGGLAVGMIGFAVPQILGVGYNVISDILNGSLTFQLVALIATSKALAWVVAMGSKTSGGTLAPMFMVGDAVGFIVGASLLFVLPSAGFMAGAFAIAGMAAVFGTASRAPFTSIIFALEATGAYQGVLPVIVTVVIAELVGERLMPESIMTEKLARRGLLVRHIYEYNPLRQITVSDVMSSPVISAEESVPVVDIVKKMNDPAHPFSRTHRIAVNSDGAVVGMLERGAIFEAASQAEASLTAGRLCSRDFDTIEESEVAYQALRKMVLHDMNYLLAVDGAGRVVGYVSMGDLMRATKGKIEDESLLERR
jgi:H+/Cl- antiporter ClcA